MTDWIGYLITIRLFIYLLLHSILFLCFCRVSIEVLCFVKRCSFLQSFGLDLNLWRAYCNSNYINSKSSIQSHQYLVIVSVWPCRQSGKVNTNTVLNSLWGPQMCVIAIDRFLSGDVRVCGSEEVRLGFWNKALQLGLVVAQYFHSISIIDDNIILCALSLSHSAQYSTVHYRTVQCSTEQNRRVQ